MAASPRHYFGCAIRCLVLCAGLALAAPAWSQASSCGQPQDVTGRPRIGLALAGGGGLGWAHIGVLQVLEELRIPIDCIAGTSAGSIIGGVYAAGGSPGAMEREVVQADWTSVFRDTPGREGLSFDRKLQDLRGLWDVEVGLGKDGVKVRAGVFAGQEVNQFLRRLTIGAVGARSFDELAIPYRAVAADIKTGALVVLDRGDLAAAMRASMAVPGVFTPERIEGRLLVDGGIKQNLPVQTVRAMGADVVIAVNFEAAPEPTDEQLASPLAVTMQMIDVLITDNVRVSLATLTPDDVLIVAKVAQYSSADFSKGAELIPLGRSAAQDVTDDLKRYSLDQGAYDAFRRAQRERLRAPLSVDRVEVDASRLRMVNPERVRKMFADELAGARPNQATIARKTATLIGEGDYERVDFAFRDGEDGTRSLVIVPSEKPWGPGYLRFGVRLATDFKEEVGFDLLGSYRRHWLNRWGAQWRADASVGQTTALRNELYQPLTLGGGLFVAPSFSFSQRSTNIFLGDDAVARYRVRSLFGRMDVGWTFGAFGEARLGVYRGEAEFDPSIAVPFAPSEDASTGGIAADLIVDRLDSVNFPRSGVYALLSWRDSLEALGADDEYQRAAAALALPVSFGRHTLQFNVKGGDTLSGTLPTYDLFTLGGLFNLSGYQYNQLAGSSSALAALRYSYQLATVPLLLRGLYAGASLELGNVWHRLDGTPTDGLLASGALFIAVDSAFGPMYLAWGHAFDDEIDTVYFYLGTFY
jgi:NTE family protein